MRRAAVAGMLVVAMVAAADSARADTISVSGGVLTYTGSATESSAPFIDTNSIDDDLEFDAGSGRLITTYPSPRCGPNEGPKRFVTCLEGGITRAVVNLGSASDSVLATDFALPMTVNAGDGFDTITGGLAADVLNGEGGGDTLNGDGVFGGAASDDEINGGPGDDSLRGRVGSDVLRGGDGFDEAYYLERSAGVSVSIDGVANDGELGELDNVLADVEELQGGGGADVLVGDGDAERLVGEGGADRLIGNGGADEFLAGTGADVLEARDGLSEDVNCGDDADTAVVDLTDVPSNCEAIDASAAAQFDADGDGLDDPRDCNDLSAAIRPGALDVLDNGIDEDCSGADAVNPDRDGDGSPRPADCDDGNAAIRPGARDKRGNKLDEDCAGGPAPFKRVRAEIVNAWRIYANHTEVGKLLVRGVGARAKVVVRCRGGGCPFKAKTFAVPRKGRDLRSAFSGRALAPGTTLELRVQRARMIAKVVRYGIRDGKGPKTTALCLPPGASKPRSC